MVSMAQANRMLNASRVKRMEKIGIQKAACCYNCSAYKHNRTSGRLGYCMVHAESDIMESEVCDHFFSNNGKIERL